MSESSTIECPKCGETIELGGALAEPIIAATRKEYEEKIRQSEKNISDREKAIKEDKEKVAQAQERVDDLVAERMKEQQKVIAEDEAKKARRAINVELEGKDKQLTELEKEIEQKNEKLAEAQKAQAGIVKKERQLQDEKRELELTIEKGIDEASAKVYEKAKKESDEANRLKIAEKEKALEDQKRLNAEMQRKLDQGSQQLQGEVQELDLEQTLAAKFPYDAIDPIPKGEFGGDVLQVVHNSSGQKCGTIIWESKRTKSWGGDWLAKLRGDQRTAKADIAIMVSQSLPKNVKSFDTIDGVVVVEYSLVIPIAMVMRQQLIEVASTRVAGEGQQTKMELVYKYLTGPNFKQRVQGIVEAFSMMYEELAKEKKQITKQWAKREKQIEIVMESTAGMWGDLQGIAGKTMQEIEGLDIQLLEADDSDSNSGGD